jgi:large subunit ribosomal protein L17
MRKHVFGRQFKRDANERKALFKNLLTSLVLEERIKTTEAKAKAIKAAADKLVTKAKKGETAYKLLHPDVNQKAVVKLIQDIAPRFAKRQGGYTRVVKLSKRRVADNADMALIEWTESSVKQNNIELKTSSSVKTSADKRNLKKAKKSKVVKEKVEAVKPAIGKKEEKLKKPGILN